jgi:hypothetical protein
LPIRETPGDGADPDFLLLSQFQAAGKLR